MAADLTNLPVVYVDRNDNSAKLAAYYVDEISHSLNAAVPSAFSIGELLIAAKRDLPHGDFLKMVNRELPFGPRTAQNLMRIASDRRLRSIASLLPPKWTILHQLSCLSDEEFAAKFEAGIIRPTMRRSDAARPKAAAGRDVRKRQPLLQLARADGPRRSRGIPPVGETARKVVLTPGDVRHGGKPTFKTSRQVQREIRLSEPGRVVPLWALRLTDRRGRPRAQLCFAAPQPPKR